MSDAAKLFMVFDVESIGLHGEGFAVGWVVVDREGAEHSFGLLACPRGMCHGMNKNREWVNEHVPHVFNTDATPREMRSVFWRHWLQWKAKGAVLVADCCWPVEAKFLLQCVNDEPVAREWDGPYPLHDLASVMLTLGRDPLATHERLHEELPVHHPLADARQSARLLVEALKDERGVA